VQQHPLELAGNWLEQARRDLDTARYLFEGARYDAACFAAQQAAEKALKAALIWLAGDRPRTHQLGVLIDEVASHRADAVEALGDIAGLDPYYVTTRYPDAIGGGIPGASFFAPEGTLAIERASRAVAYVAALLPSPSET
jgi:HEPN domain-containing protein